MNSFTEFIAVLPDYIGILLLMFSTFLIGYFSASYLKKTKERKIIKRLKEEVNMLQIRPRKNERAINDIETIFTEIKPKIVEVVKQTQENINEDTTKETIAEKRVNNFIEYTKEKPKLNFEIIGLANGKKDDLTKIEGIGPYVQQRLNEIGIFNLEQISNLRSTDIVVITELIDFFPERIERDNWVEQARKLKFQHSR
jgi:predicted flap endonuclease-1-like 5' DNA nuclease